MVLKTLVAWKENMVASPKQAELTPFFFTPKEWAPS